MAEEKKNNTKRFYWLKLPNDYFKRLDQRKMYRQPNGESMQRIYLKMLLLAVDKGGFIRFQNVFDDLTEEIAEEIFEDVELVEQTVAYCKENGLLEMNELHDFFLPQLPLMVGSETDSARRMRNHRERKLSQSDNESLQSDESSQCYDREREEKRLELEKELEKEHTHKENSKERFVAPQVCEVQDYLDSRDVKSFTADEFVNYYAATGWKNKHGVPIVNWKALLDSWIERKKPKQEQKEEPREKDRLDFMSAELTTKLREIGALEDDDSMNFGIAQEYGLLDAVQEADRKANEWNSKLSNKRWKPVDKLDADEWQ